MSKSILVFIPNTLEYHKKGYLKGEHKVFDDSEAYYIINDTATRNQDHCIGVIGAKGKSAANKDVKLVIDSVNGTLILNRTDDDPVVHIIYDYETFRYSNIVNEDSNPYGKHFKFLSNEIQKSRTSTSDNGQKSTMNTVLSLTLLSVTLLSNFLLGLHKMLSYSSTFLHFEETIIATKWFLTTMLQEKKVTPKLGNMFVSKIIDLLIGMVLLDWLLNNENDILKFMQFATQELIYNLKGLLLYLMGSPIGLKLNYAFNKSLGQFFFYHISLWRIFLLGLQPLFVTYFRFLVLPGVLGFSFQMSMISDLISLTTFHVYCIYVYAARLFSLQLRGLISLWRLFIGRKYNPLRNRVDSCQYSQNQLFIGTLGFTILLFLLPTTTLYYTVFSVFRLVILCFDEISRRIRYLLNIIPVYVIILWIFNSSSIAGSLHLVWNGFEKNGTMKMEAKLNKLPICCCIKKFLPVNVCDTKHSTLGYLIYNMLTGTII